MSEDGTLLAVGSEAPDFTAVTSAGKTVSLSGFRGKKGVLLMFYPKDDTPGCTRQMCLARDEAKRYSGKGILRFGVNTGSAESHRRFVEKYELDFPLLVDGDRRIAEVYGVLTENGGVTRATYLIRKDGRIAFAQLGAHGADVVLESLKGG